MRRVRKSRQKEAAGAADPGLMQIEWSGRGCRSSRRVEEQPTHLCQDEWMAEVSLGGDSKKMPRCNGDTLGETL